VSAAAAEAFLDRVETDEAFATELTSMRGDPEAALARVRAEGFDVSSDDLREAVLARFGGTLTTEQLDAIAAGADAGLIAGATVGTVIGVGMMAAFIAVVV
jgi:predicted ribosomally synthesized peptide with nif11-like leader